MSSRQSQTAPSPTFGTVLHRIAVTALLQAALVLVACMMMGSLSGGGVAPYLQAVGLCFTVVGAFALGRGLRAERRSAYDQAGGFYAVALVSYSVAYAVFLAHGLSGALGAP